MNRDLLEKNAIGFIGLGNMGSPMAANLLCAGYHVTIYDLNPERYAPLIKLGARTVGSIAEVAQPGGIVFSMTPDDQTLEQVVEELRSTLGPGGVHVPFSTVSPSTAMRLALRYGEVGVHYLAASVLGRPDLAATGKLMIFLSGDEQAKARIVPLIDGVLGTVHDLGRSLYRANTIKLAFNAYLVGEMSLLAYLLEFVERCGLDAFAFQSWLSSFVERGTVLPVYGPKIAQHQFAEAGQGFNAILGEKDLRYYITEAERLNVPLGPFAEIYEHLVQAVIQGQGNQSWACFTEAIFPGEEVTGRGVGEMMTLGQSAE